MSGATLDLTGVVLAGGVGRRMGGPKAFLPAPDGRPLVEAALDALRAAGAREVLVAAREAAPFLVLVPPVEVVLDRGPDLGPVAGLEAALRRTTTDWVLVVACDMPRLDPGVLRRVAEAAQGSAGRLAVVPRAGDRLEPLHAAYHRHALPRVTAALDEGRLRLTEVVAALDPLVLDVPAGPSFDNWNRPADVDR
ncbi:MAG: molybdenum cofactor guanylyltransferase [Planctomycetes bacterium]|nr:molybdenum cofactor guanylyltransferase [Planctomycetota bacterium]